MHGLIRQPTRKRQTIVNHQADTIPYDELIQLPDLTIAEGSLSPMERSLIAHFIMLSRPKTIIELGVFEAHTSVFMCDVLKMNGLDATVYGFDLAPVISNLRDNNTEVNQLEDDDKLSLVPGALPQSLIDWLDKNKQDVDFALVDARHDYYSVMTELRLLYPRLKRGGFILCHDYSDKYDSVYYAINRFARANGAMVLPLASTPEATDKGHHSVLVAVAKPIYPHYLTRNVYLAFQSRLIHSKLWQKYLKPILRRS